MFHYYMFCYVYIPEMIRNDGNVGMKRKKNKRQIFSPQFSRFHSASHHAFNPRRGAYTVGR